jgi:hypothetical protein
MGTKRLRTDHQKHASLQRVKKKEKKERSADLLFQGISRHQYAYNISKSKHPNIRVFYLPTDAQENCFKKNFKIYIKTAPTCFGLITIIRECVIQAC